MIVNSQNLKNTTTIDIESWITTANDAVNTINKKIKILINRYKKSNGYKDFYIFSTPMRKTSQSGKIFYKANITRNSTWYKTSVSEMF